MSDINAIYRKTRELIKAKGASSKVTLEELSMLFEKFAGTSSEGYNLNDKIDEIKYITIPAKNFKPDGVSVEIDHGKTITIKKGYYTVYQSSSRR